MKTTNYFITTVLLSAMLMSCEDEPTQPLKQPISIQFVDAQHTLEEGDDAGVSIELALSRAAVEDGIAKLRINGESWKRLETTPAHSHGLIELPVTKGIQQLHFTAKSIDNTEADGDVLAEILIEPSGSLTPGEQHSLALTINDNDSDTPVQSVANFAEQVESTLENGEALEYRIMLSTPAAAESRIVIEVTSDNSAVFATDPATDNGKLTLMAPVGTSELSFSVSLRDNSEVNGHSQATFAIHSTEGSISKGTDLTRALTIKDDELVGKVRGYESTGAHDAMKRFYSYDAKGRIAKIDWETYTPFKRSGTETYFYDEQDRIIKINKYPGRDVHYRWENGRIVRSEVYQNEDLIEYANYAYDDHGNVAGVEPYHKQGDGSFKRGLFTVHLYFTDGNIYKSLIYTDVANATEPLLISTRTYDHYRAEANPISMVEVLPTVMSQKNLAGSYRVEQNDFDFNYTLSYEFGPDGQPSKRKAVSSNDTQTVLYYYY
ncbi:MAG TPA: hypothetical protein VFW11_04000 [Cyclobacteriaceae bacterium]|nr:hypothetical protein [Cyclobacteriaceae bacterium]